VLRRRLTRRRGQLKAAPLGRNLPPAPLLLAATRHPRRLESSQRAVNPDKVIEPGSQKVNVKPGSIDDVSAVGNRDIGARGMGNWYSTDTEIKMGKTYALRRSRRAPSSSPIRWSPNT
jgi:hypothetical protein